MGSAQTVPRSGYVILLVTATGIVLVMSRSACEDVGVRRKRMWEGVGISRWSHGSWQGQAVQATRGVTDCIPGISKWRCPGTRRLLYQHQPWECIRRRGINPDDVAHLVINLQFISESKCTLLRYCNNKIWGSCFPWFPGFKRLVGLLTLTRTIDLQGMESWSCHDYSGEKATVTTVLPGHGNMSLESEIGLNLQVGPSVTRPQTVLERSDPGSHSCDSS